MTMRTEETFIPTAPLNVAVLFLVFNRLDTTRQVFESIRRARPPRLYIAADGARMHKDGELEIVNAVRDYVVSNIDWECQIKTLFRDKNMGCKYAVSSAISWFFEHEEQGIILEDDCLPNQSFFWFCEELLEKYKNDQRIMMVSGTNYLLDVRGKVDGDYLFSRHFSIWGWATWRRAWDTYDVELDLCTDEFIGRRDYSYLALNGGLEKVYKGYLELIRDKRVDTWDYQWLFNCIYSYGLSIVPPVNLISNLGIEGAHASGVTENNFLRTYDVALPLRQAPRHVVPNMYHDSAVSARNFKFDGWFFLKNFARSLLIRLGYRK